MKLVDAELFENTLRDIGIPPRPAALDVIAREIQKDSPDLHVLEKALRGDVALSAGVIKVANSTYFGLQTRVRTILEAIEVMGLRSVSKVIACVSLRTAFPNLNLERFWDGSMKVATLSAWLVGEKRWKGLSQEDAYTFGLFRDCGIAVLLQRMPSYVDVLRKANTDASQPFTEIECDVIPVSHAHVGAILTQAWWLPLEISEGIRHHHDLQAIETGISDLNLPTRSGTLIAVSQMGEYFVQQITGKSHTREWEKLGEACLNRLSIDKDELTDLCRSAQDALEGC